jgi:acyl-CoA reductase-like NAD-dependent aldehyde dehydrogenase
MNLIAGQLMDQAQSKNELHKLDHLICRTLERGDLPVHNVIAACHRLSQRLNDKDHLHLLMAFGMTEQKARHELAYVKTIMSQEYMEERLRIEFGNDISHVQNFIPFASKHRVRQAWKPLGTLLHIAAGNVDALPVFSVIEGLLTGNINILKLPGSDDGLSIAILAELIKEEPLIADYVYVFDYPSEDIDSLKKMAEAADAIVVWGGDAAVSAVRSMAKPNTKIIEWGHKISFAYVSGERIPDASLIGVAQNICETQQLFCNSCQGIYLDTENLEEVVCFAERFLSILDEVSKSCPAQDDLYLQAQKTLQLYTERLEAVKRNKRVFQTENCSVIAFDNHILEPSYMFGNCWVKPLPREKIIPVLRPYKNYLQTVALICEENRKSEFEGLLLKLGVVRITNGRNMSKSYCGIPHDGEFPLQRYMKRVSYEYGSD